MSLPPIGGRPASEPPHQEKGANKSGIKSFFSGLVKSIFGGISSTDNDYIEQSKRQFREEIAAAKIEDSKATDAAKVAGAAEALNRGGGAASAAVRAMDGNVTANEVKEPVSSEKELKLKEIYMHRRHMAAKEAKEAILGEKDVVKQCENIFKHIGNCEDAEIDEILETLPLEKVLLQIGLIQDREPALLQNEKVWNKLMMFVIDKEKKLYDQKGNEALANNLTQFLLEKMCLYAPVEVQNKFLNSLNPDKLEFFMKALAWNAHHYIPRPFTKLNQASYEFVAHIYLMSLITSNERIKQELEKKYPGEIAFMKTPNSENHRYAGRSLKILKRFIQLEKATEKSVIDGLKMQLKQNEGLSFYKLCESIRKNPKFLSLLD